MNCYLDLEHHYPAASNFADVDCSPSDSQLIDCNRNDSSRCDYAAIVCSDQRTYVGSGSCLMGH